MRGMKYFVVLATALFVLSVSFSAFAETVKIGIMQDDIGQAKKFRPLVAYLEKFGVDAVFKQAKDYPTAAQMFSEGELDAMFSGSGVAGTMIIKGVAGPVVRPLSKEGTSTYWAVVLAPKGTKNFDGKASYFKGKKVTFCSLASSGEFYFHSLGNPQTSNIVKAPSHNAAIKDLSEGKADVAIVKNRVWDKVKADYPGLVKIGEDKGENPDGTLIVSTKTSAAVAKKLSDALLALGDDSSKEAAEVKEALGVKGYIKTTKDDFSHTLGLLKEAGVTPAFNFEYK